MDDETVEVVKGRDCRLFYQLVQDNNAAHITVNQLAAEEDEGEEVDTISKHCPHHLVDEGDTTSLAEELSMSVNSCCHQRLQQQLAEPDILTSHSGGGGSGKKRQAAFPDFGILRLVDSRTTSVSPPPPICDAFSGPEVSGQSDDDDDEAVKKEDRTSFTMYDLEGDNYDELLPAEDDWDMARVLGPPPPLQPLPPPQHQTTGPVDVVVRQQPASSGETPPPQSGFRRTGQLMKRKMVVQQLDRLEGHDGVCGQVANMCTIM